MNYICDEAFYGCSTLRDVYCHAENVPITEGYAFEDTPIASATLHVPAGSIEEYKATSPWSGFGNIVAITGTSVKDIPFSGKSNYFDLQGRRLPQKPTQGINIIRHADGTTRKVLIK